MCLTLKPKSHCQRCGELVSFTDLDQPCSEASANPDLGMGGCGTLTWRDILGPRDYVCDDCSWSVDGQDDLNEWDSRYPQSATPGLFEASVNNSVHLASLGLRLSPKDSEDVLPREFATSRGAFEDQEEPIVWTSPARHDQPQAWRQASQAHTRPEKNGTRGDRFSSKHDSEYQPLQPRLDPRPLPPKPALTQRSPWKPKSRKYAYTPSSPSETPQLLTLEDFNREGSFSNSQSAYRIREQTPPSARAILIESPWQTSQPPPAQEDVWIPDLWGPAKDLPAELAQVLDHTIAADTYNKHRFYLFYNDGPDAPVAENTTVVVATPRGHRARVLSGEVYEEGARLVRRRQAERERYERLAERERSMMRENGKYCIFRVCRVSSCPMMHKEGQHQPLSPRSADAYLQAQAGTLPTRRKWRTYIPRPVTPPTGRRWSPSPLNVNRVRLNVDGVNEERDWSRGSVTPQPVTPQATVSDEEGRPEIPSQLRLDSERKTKAEPNALLEYQGRVGRIRPQYSYGPTVKLTGSPPPRSRSDGIRLQQKAPFTPKQAPKTEKLDDAAVKDNSHSPSCSQDNTDHSNEAQSLQTGLNDLRIYESDEDATMSSSFNVNG
ncbi:hypothetical protein EsH8_VI_001185 [Colletotrichum jinshuiense]